MANANPVPVFGPRAHEFFAELEANNNREWFNEHKTEYLHEVKEPMEAVFARLAAEFGPAKLFRINRDLRFSKDKTPYKTAQAGTVDQGGRGVLYFQITATGATIGGGVAYILGEQLQRFRDAVAGEPGEELTRLIGALNAEDVVVGTLGEDGVTAEGDLKRVPAGYPPDHPRAALLRLKRLVAARAWDRPAWLSTDPAATIAEYWRRYDPVMEWLDEYVGVSEPRRRGNR